MKFSKIRNEYDMKIAVLMSTYNGEKFVEEQINSILNQKGDFTIHLIVRDDGSIDATQNILEEYQNKGFLKWSTGKNLGPAKSFMYLIKENPGYDFYAFSDQDDYWLPDKLKRALYQLSGINKPAVYFSNAELVDENLESLGRLVYKEKPKVDLETLTCAGGVLGCTVVFNKIMAHYLQIYPNPDQIIMHDFYVSLLCVALNGQLIFDPVNTMKYRQHSKNVIGVSHGILGTLIGRIKDIVYKEPVGIAKQANEIIKIYRKDLPQYSLKWLEKIENYNTGFLNQIKLALSKQTAYINKNMSIKIRLSILMGHR